LLVGRSVEGIAGACTYAAARRHGLPRTLDELTALSHVDRTKVGRGYRYISRELELTIPPVDPKSHVRRLVATLGYGRNVHRRACDFVDAADSASTVVGARPLTVACGSLYAATLVVGDEELTQAELADTAGLSTHTLRRRYRDVLDAVDGPPIRETSDPTADVS
jgi:transcription initiation factor TFIIB